MSGYEPSRNTVRSWTVERFAGVDFSTDPTKVDSSRSPDACNMIADATFFPVKRTGYRREYQFDGAVFGLHRYDGELLVHAGSKLYRAKDRTVLYADMAESRSVSFRMGGKLWLLDGKTYLVYDGQSVSAVREHAFVPTTTIGAPPSGGGTSLEAVNLLTPYRINTFAGDGSSVSFQLDCTNIDRDSVTCTSHRIFSVNHAKGIVTFEKAPEDAGGLANVIIRFAKTVPGYADKIDRCRIFGLYGGKNDTRVFVSGNPQEPNTDWQSGLYDPSYFPDNGYTRIGSDSSAVMGYLRQYDTQLVLKQDGQDAKQYLRTFSLDENGRPMYALKQGAEAAGALGFDSLATLGDVPMYLSAEGVMGVFGTEVSQQRTISGVSARIDKKLKKEMELGHAAAVAWNNRLYLAVGGHCYVADGRQMLNGVPEWYFWDNVPAACFLAEEQTLRFGTADGRVCCFCKENDWDAYYDDGQAIRAHWSTPFSPLGKWGRSKNILSFTPVLMPYRRTSAEIICRTDKGRKRAKTVALHVFSFAQFSFRTFTFHAIASAVPVCVCRRQRRVHLFQAIVRNTRAGEPFGILSMVTRYTVRTPVQRK